MQPRIVEISRTDWARTLDQFSAVHDRWLVSLDVYALAIGAQPEFTNLPLVGITFEPAGQGAVVVSAARANGDQLTHTLAAPRRMWLRRTAGGADVALEIEGSDGSETVVRLKTAAGVETVDGVAARPAHV